VIVAADIEARGNTQLPVSTLVSTSPRTVGALRLVEAAQVRS
jgi:hypothetical protein